MPPMPPEPLDDAAFDDAFVVPEPLDELDAFDDDVVAPLEEVSSSTSPPLLQPTETTRTEPSPRARRSAREAISHS